jgi:hypothetical protein
MTEFAVQDDACARLVGGRLPGAGTWPFEGLDLAEGQTKRRVGLEARANEHGQGVRAAAWPSWGASSGHADDIETFRPIVLSWMYRIVCCHDNRTPCL